MINYDQVLIICSPFNRYYSHDPPMTLPIPPDTKTLYNPAASNTGCAINEIISLYGIMSCSWSSKSDTTLYIIALLNTAIIHVVVTSAQQCIDKSPPAGPAPSTNQQLAGRNSKP